MFHEKPTNEIIFVAKPRFSESVGGQEQSSIFDASCRQNYKSALYAEPDTREIPDMDTLDLVHIGAGLELYCIRM